MISISHLKILSAIIGLAYTISFFVPAIGGDGTYLGFEIFCMAFVGFTIEPLSVFPLVFANLAVPYLLLTTFLKRKSPPVGADFIFAILAAGSLRGLVGADNRLIGFYLWISSNLAAAAVLILRSFLSKDRNSSSIQSHSGR